MSELVYLGIDFETTGLDPQRHRIIEVGLVVLTADLSEVFAWETQVACPAKCLNEATHRVKAMHLESGLFEQVDETTVRLSAAAPMALHDVEETLCAIAGRFPEPPIPLGHTIQFDRGMAKHWMPAFEAMLHYRQFDCRTLKMALDLEWPERTGPEHRALADIRHSADIARAAV